MDRARADVAERRLAHARAHPARRHGASDRVGRGLSVSDRDRASACIDRQGRPLGTDFSNVYAAGTYVLDGNPQAPFDPPQQFAREQAIFGQATQFYGWHYPPFFLFVAAALAWMPYGLALAVWQAVTLGLYLLTIRAILKAASPGREAHNASRTACGSSLALAFPAVLINIGHGQNGFLTAALLGGALVVLDRRPIVAGILLGLLVYKPQYGLLIPLVLAVSGRWKCFAAAAVTVALSGARHHAHLRRRHVARLSCLDRVHAHRRARTRQYRLVQDPERVLLGAHVGRADPAGLCTAGAVIVGIGAALVWLWRSAAPYRAQGRGLCLATILATPYSFDYDMMVLAPAIAFIAVRRFLPQLRAVGEDFACGALADAARRPQHCSNKSDSTRRAGDAGDVCSHIAAQRIVLSSISDMPTTFTQCRRGGVREPSCSENTAASSGHKPATTSPR